MNDNLTFEQWYADLSAKEQGLMRRGIRLLLSRTFLIKSRERELFGFFARNVPQMETYFAPMGYTMFLERDYGIIMLRDRQEEKVDAQENAAINKKIFTIRESVIYSALAWIFMERMSGSLDRSILIRPEALIGRQVDLLIVTVRDADGVQRFCREAGIGEDSVLYLKNHTLLADRNICQDKAEAVLGAAFLEKLRGSERVIRRPLWSDQETLPQAELEGDYVRLKTLELLCRQIDSVPGAAAELGVYRGGFARCINQLLPDRMLYLFDTFCGFDREEAAEEGQGFVSAHRNTGAERVLASMPHRSRVILRQGLFPETATGLEERFALVSLDVDLEESTLAGLRWFMPRLQTGGYLLLHDYFSPKLPGVKKALARWEAENALPLHKFPVCDVNGTLVLSL